MLVYRLAHPKYAKDISGYGSLMVPGRWNFKGHRVLYTAENSSLAFLEYLAHTQGLQRRLPYILVTIEVPDGDLEIFPRKKLSKNWKEEVVKTRAMGSEWLDKAKSLLLKVPSVINEEDHNILINPNHPEFEKVKIVTSKAITFDDRL